MSLQLLRNISITGMLKDPDQEKWKREVLSPNARLQMNICLQNLKLTIVVSYALTIQIHIDPVASKLPTYLPT
jgi:hypothetical protein